MYYVMPHYKEDTLVLKFVNGELRFLSAGGEPRWISFEWHTTIDGHIKYDSLEALLEAQILPQYKVERLLQVEI